MQSLLAVIVPAHNEELNIRQTIRSLQECRDADLIVVADNCTDRTLEIAKECGVRTLTRTDETHRGKPFALAYAFDILLAEGYQYFAIVDADTTVDPRFTQTIMNEFANGADAVQVRYAQSCTEATLMQRLSIIAFNANNTIKPRGRSFWGLSCGIQGNGFALSRKTLEKVPYKVTSIVEDLVYHIQLVKAGCKVRFSEEATVWSAPAPSSRGMRTQHARWDGGRLSALREEGLSLLKLILQGRLDLIEPFLDLLLPPLAFQAATLFPLFFIDGSFFNLYAWMGFGTIAIYSFIGVWINKGGWKDWLALALSPLYILWKLTMIPNILKAASKNAAWKRTERHKDSP